MRRHHMDKRELSGDHLTKHLYTYQDCKASTAATFREDALLKRESVPAASSFQSIKSIPILFLSTPTTIALLYSSPAFPPPSSIPHPLRPVLLSPAPKNSIYKAPVGPERTSAFFESRCQRVGWRDAAVGGRVAAEAQISNGVSERRCEPERSTAVSRDRVLNLHHSSSSQTLNLHSIIVEMLQQSAVVLAYDWLLVTFQVDWTAQSFWGRTSSSAARYGSHQRRRRRRRSCCSLINDLSATGISTDVRYALIVNMWSVFRPHCPPYRHAGAGFVLILLLSALALMTASNNPVFSLSRQRRAAGERRRKAAR
ncbi:uncharacterized protein V6R79_018529 [Siganus canaliculatus]